MSKSNYPQANETSGFPWTYINLVSGDDIVSILENQTNKMRSFYQSIPNEKWTYSYAPGKWTLIGTLRHIIDAERVFAYRVLRFLRNDSTPLPGFDQDEYMEQIDEAGLDIKALLDEWEAVRASTIALLKSIPAEGWDRVGEASGTKHTVRAVAYTLTGHELHHERLTKERYLD